MSTTARNKFIVQRGLQLLIVEHAYSQISIYRKLKALDVKVSRASISNLWKAQRSIGAQLWKEGAKGLLILLRRELCLEWNDQKKDFDPIIDCRAQTINIKKTIVAPSLSIKQPTALIHDGRRDVSEKVALYQKATQEVIEIGIRLKNFTSYFSEKRASAFIDPLLQQLETGVRFRCYLLNPTGNIARRFVEDRASVQPIEKTLLQDIPLITKELQQTFQQLNQKKLPGKMQLYQYDHFPYFHASVIDGDVPNGHLFLTPYILGVSRANTPVLEINRHSNKAIFKRYWRSILTITQSKRTIRLV